MTDEPVSAPDDKASSASCPKCGGDSWKHYTECQKDDKASELARLVDGWYIRPFNKLPVDPQERIAHLAVLLRRHLGEERWIPVSEKLPELGEWVMVVYQGNIQRLFARRCQEGWEWSDLSADTAPIAEMSHWRPLPAGPAEGGRS